MNYKENKPLPHPLKNIANISKFNKKGSVLLSAPQPAPTPEPREQRPTIVPSIVYCSNHPTVLSSHKINEEEQTLYYCDKCSTLLENQGFSTSPLSNSHQSKMFMDKLSECLGEVQTRRSQTLEREDRLSFNYEKMVKKIAGYKHSIITKIQSLFSKQLETLTSTFERQMNVLETEKSSLVSHEKHIKSILRDIEQNIKGIDKVPTKSFASAIQQYTAVLAKYQKQTGLKSEGMESEGKAVELKRPIEESLVINEGSHANDMLFSLADTLKSIDYQGTLFSSKIRMVESLNQDPSLSEDSIVEYRTQAVQRLF